jgi:hypothetical protein
LEARLKKWSNFGRLFVFNPEGKMETFASKKSRACDALSIKAEGKD